jgi:hypothetical protein
MRALEDAAGIEYVTDAPVSRRTPLSVTPLPVTPIPASRDSAAAFAPTMAPTGEVTTAPRRRWWIAGLALALGGTLAFVALGGSKQRSVAPVAPTPPAALSTPAPAAAPAPVPPPSRLVTITINGTPDHTEVFGPQGPLGFAPGTITLLRGADDVQLVLRAAGHVDRVASVRADADKVIEVTLEKVAAAPVVTKKPRPTTRPKPTPEPAKPAPGKRVDDPYARH